MIIAIVIVMVTWRRSRTVSTSYDNGNNSNNIVQSSSLHDNNKSNINSNSDLEALAHGLDDLVHRGVAQHLHHPVHPLVDDGRRLRGACARARTTRRARESVRRRRRRRRRSVLKGGAVGAPDVVTRRGEGAEDALVRTLVRADVAFGDPRSARGAARPASCPADRSPGMLAFPSRQASNESWPAPPPPSGFEHAGNLAPAARRRAGWLQESGTTGRGGDRRCAAVD